jgi:[ribosomal protein S5]-alanine N-acetyltransferase
MQMTRTVLETERLRLRHFGPGDAAFILELLNEPSWIAHIGPRPVHDLASAAAWIEEKLVAGYARLGYGFWAVERRADAALLGMCGLIKRDSLPEVDLGYAFVPRAWGAGYAREAAAACLRHGAEVLGMQTILAITGPDNRASQRVLTGIGMRLIDTRVLEGDARQTQVYGWGQILRANSSALPV